MPAILAEYSDARLVILGEGEQRPHLEKLVQERGLEGKVELAGNQPDMPAWLSKMDVFVLPSWVEGLPTVIMETHGLPNARGCNRYSGDTGACPGWPDRLVSSAWFG